MAFHLGELPRMKVYEPTLREKFSLWVDLEDVELTFELVTYYMLCCLFGFITGLGIGSRIALVVF